MGKNFFGQINGFPLLRIGATINSSSRAHCGAKCRYADTGSFKAHAPFAIPDNACGISGMTTGPILAPMRYRGNDGKTVSRSRSP
jgi:hypothetical protein